MGGIFIWPSWSSADHLVVSSLRCGHFLALRSATRPCHGLDKLQSNLTVLAPGFNVGCFSNTKTNPKTYTSLLSTIYASEDTRGPEKFINPHLIAPSKP